ncbi:MAG TPA: 3-phosphoserine/phosphohydroxythreonine transaminase [Vulgatibacter sp.]|nr:3-phosphoserine/phosphohydroxythreonine transaminase [Vulgatibacter sp.]
MSRKHNFNAGPSILPLPALEAAAKELVDTKGLGLSVLEMSHRSRDFEGILDHARQTLRRLLSLPDDWEVLFLQGGASQQFAMVPMNLGSGGAYVTTGAWSQKALAEARIVGEAAEIWTDAEQNFRRVPRPDEELVVPAGAPYLHYTTNNTIFGTQWHHVPSAPVPLVADMSSDILSREIDLKPFGLVYAGAQKNAGPSGVTLVLGRREILENFAGPGWVPKILRYQTHAKAGSLYNTPPTFGIWLCSLVFDWIEREGGLAEMARRAEAKSARLYDVIDRRPDVFVGHAERSSRSKMNVTFTMRSPEVEKRFLEEAKAKGCIGLSGHRSVGGLRASIYNALPMESVEVLASVMERFEP